MSARTDMTRIFLTLLTAMWVGTLLLSGGAPATAKEWDSETYNVYLGIPDSPSAWAWLPAGPSCVAAGLTQDA